MTSASAGGRRADDGELGDDGELLSEDRERWLVRLFQLGLVAIAAYGLYRGRTGVVVNGLVGLGVTLIPAVLRRDFGVSLAVDHLLWISVAVFLHAVGVLGPYQHVPWYDSLTHALSAAIVAGAGYATVKAVDRNSDRTNLTPAAESAFVVVFVLAFGVFWEILEFLPSLLGMKGVLIQYGLDDTVHDLVFDLAGGLLVAGWDSARPEEAADEATEAMDD